MENNVLNYNSTPFVPTRNALKAILIIILFFVTFLVSISTFFFQQLVFAHENSVFFSNALSLTSTFGAGVFMGTCLLDILPELLESFKKADELSKSFEKFPVPELFIAIGFFIVLFMEQTILYASEKKWIGNPESDRLLAHNSLSNENSNNQINSNAFSHARDPEHLQNNNLPQINSSIRVILLVFALSLHAVFEGISLGMIVEVPVLLQVFFALIIHKTIIGFSLGIRLVQSKLKRWTTVVCCIIFAGQIIFGGFMGLAVIDALNNNLKSTSYFISGILQAIACGTFLYITCFEILPHELNNSKHRPLKVLCLLLGFLLIAFLVLLFPDS